MTLVCLYPQFVVQFPLVYTENMQPSDWDCSFRLWQLIALSHHSFATVSEHKSSEETPHCTAITYYSVKSMAIINWESKHSIAANHSWFLRCKTWQVCPMYLFIDSLVTWGTFVQCHMIQLNSSVINSPFKKCYNMHTIHYSLPLSMYCNVRWD